MTFSSLEFLFFFFPIVLAVHFILPSKVRNYWLLAASLFFYAWGESSFFLLLILSIFVNYILGLALDRLSRSVNGDESNQRAEFFRKALFILLLLLNFGPLFVFKYLNAITAAIHSYIPAWQGMIPQTSFVLPLAISFYTFQSVSYIIDIYRGMPAEKNPFNYALFICFFPQLLQGPILRFRDFRPQLMTRKITAEGFSEGILRFLTGFNQKILLANILSEAANAAFDAGELSVGMAWLGMLAYSLQLYFDFAGYSDMAVGLGKMFGFSFAENFNFPYASESITEFWRRWHITLGTWFRDYLYFPLGGSRVKPKFRIALNLLIVWLATGIWHGADLTFVLWGMLHGAVIVFEKMTNLPKQLEKKPAARFLYHGAVLFIAMFGWMLFRANDMPHAVFYAKSLFRLSHNPWRDSLFKFNSREYIVTFLFAILSAFPLCRMLRSRISARGETAASAVRLVWYLIQLLLAVISVSCLVISSHNPFWYQNF